METATPSDLGPDTITVTAVVRDEMAADRAELHVTVQGSSLISGDMALTRAREVGHLVADLKSVGVDEADITLESVRANTTTGMISKTSSATYSLRVVVRDLKRVADVLGAVTSQKNTTLGDINWRYADNEERWLALLDECLKQTRAKALRVAAGLGVTLLGVHRFSETRLDPRSHSFITEDHAGRVFSRGRVITDEDLGLKVSHAKSIELRVDIEYRISGFVKHSKEAA